ncbi:ABC transporter permease [Bifidobacterium jacchi]|uniref:ABC transporter permease n=1 Tax=Bifidobacterium jacchi TaxID=2490545 RepID=A0A5N5RHW8_9BIFI|nr:ABC transporter permease [Bifidobacterium jacchi]KAB5606530.1 ABC transporter permease [Bifidobacterium jacchi]
MFVVKNAWRNVIRNKGRNILVAIIVAIIAAAATIGLAIRQAADNARETGLENSTITAQISFDRSKAISEISSQTSDSSSSDSDSSGRPDFDAMRESLEGKQLTLADYEKYAKASSAVKSTYYTQTSSVNETDDFQPVEDSSSSAATSSSDSDSSSTDTNSNTAQPNDGGQQPGGDMGGDQAGGRGGMGGMMQSSGDFSLIGFSSDEAVANAANGTFTMSSGEVFGYDSDSDGDVIISKELADFNGLKVGDTFTVENVSDEDTTYTLTIVGIYENTSDSTGQMGGPMRSTSSDPANAIYTSVSTLAKLGLDSDSTLETTDSNGDTTERAAAQLSYTYVFSGKDDYETFVKDVAKAGLSDDYTVSSTDVEQYESSLVPLDNLSQFALTLLLIVLGVGAVVIVVITLFNVRERKYEVGVLTAIGVKKVKVAAQFTFELLVVTMIGLAIGVAGGAAASVPVSNQLLSAQVAQQESQASSQNAQFGRDMQGPGAPGGASSNDSSSDSADTSNSDSNSDGNTGNAANGGAQTPANGRQQGGPGGMMTRAVDYVSTVNATVNLKVVGQLLLIGLGLTLVAALVAVVFVMRYEPLQILADRS